MATHGATAKAPVTHQSCNVIARLDALPETQGGVPDLARHAVVRRPHTPRAAPKPSSSAPTGSRSARTISTRAPGRVGSILAFGNAWRDADRGVISVGWINTCVSAQKVQGE